MVDIVIGKKEHFRQLWENTIKPKVIQGLEGGPARNKITTARAEISRND